VSAETFGAWLKRQLNRREWNQSDLARRLETRPGVVSHWVRGDRIPDPESCRAIADALHLDEDLVLALAGHRTATEPLKPDDPATEFVGMVKRVRWDDEERVEAMRETLQRWLRFDKARRERERGKQP
jgi:transcriptional regulator with XRE-family HTH domain